MENVFYINPEHRIDRKEFTENQLNALGWKYERFNAISHKNGAIGCFLSHINVIKNAIKNKFDYCVILEDDVLFTDIANFNNHIKSILELEFDVFLLAGNVNKSAKKQVVDSNQNIFKISNVQTTTAYIVKSSYYERLLSNFIEGYKKLLKQPKLHNKYAVDIYWKQLQIKDRWLIKLPLTITQKASYSDIQKGYRDYESLLLKF